MRIVILPERCCKFANRFKNGTDNVELRKMDFNDVVQKQKAERKSDPLRPTEVDHMNKIHDLQEAGEHLRTWFETENSIEKPRNAP